MGEPAQVNALVIHPVLAGPAKVGEHFLWFVENDRRHKKAVPPIGPGVALPLLERYSRAPKKAPKKRGNRKYR